MLSLQRGTVVEARDPAGSVQRLDVEVEGERRPAVADTALVGPAEAGDEVVVNVAARDLGLGSGGFDVVHVNLSRGLGGAGVPGAHVMKLNSRACSTPCCRWRATRSRFRCRPGS